MLGGVVLDDLAAGQAVARIFSTGYDRFTDQQAACGYCAHPIRLRGTATTIDTATGEVLSRYDTPASRTASRMCGAGTGARQSARPARVSTRATCGTCSPPAPQAA